MELQHVVALHFGSNYVEWRQQLIHASNQFNTTKCSFQLVTTSS